MSRRGTGLESVEAFEALPTAALGEIARSLRRRLVTRGEILVRQGERAEALYIVVSGRFHVELDGQPGAIAEIGAGSPIGEIAFFTGELRTASVRASRDAVVLELGRDEFQTLSARLPMLWNSIAASLARRLAQASATLKPRERTPPACIALVPCGDEAPPRQFMLRLREALQDIAPHTAVLDRDAIPAEIMASITRGTEQATTWFNELEAQHGLIVYICGSTLDPWSEKVLRQADEVLLIGTQTRRGPGWQAPLNAVERLARGVHDSDAHRLVIVHPVRGTLSGTARWFETRPVRMHHHVALRADADYRRLARFLAGQAVGLVACGGGALCATHVGVYRALTEAGLPIDMMGGTSGGGAMTAAFALGASAEQVDAALEDIFVRSRALKRMTWPRYSLLDHGQFDRSLAAHYTEVDIADLWLPFFALSSNLSTNQAHVHRHGQLWRAVRATGSIPGLLPPCYTEDGEMLVDGGLIDNVPVATMRELKWGPNIVINLGVTRRRTYDVDYATLPTRETWLGHLLRWLRGYPLPIAPGPAQVLIQSLAAHRPKLEMYMTARDLLLTPPIAPHYSMMDWQHHSELMRLGHAHASEALAQARDAGHPLFNVR
ncbi:MAG: cyclic nucleotide-binding domain-containing protein [Gammaproteobacteria bacterium]|nr:cyclic nucleotide-binding domain-containing protein [Gammaproteobacteria bacterium]